MKNLILMCFILEEHETSDTNVFDRGRHENPILMCFILGEHETSDTNVFLSWKSMKHLILMCLILEEHENSDTNAFDLGRT